MVQMSAQCLLSKTEKAQISGHMQIICSTVPDTCLVLFGKKHQRNMNTSFIQTQDEDKQMEQPHENRVKQSDVVGRSHPFADSHPIRDPTKTCVDTMITTGNH